MTDIWFTSDTHFGHGNIIKFCNRPFSSVEEMDEVLIERWNARVKPNDTVWHLGDFSFYKSYEKLNEVFNRLNGNKYLVCGNHDYDNAKRLFWEKVTPLEELMFGKQTLVLFHYPMVAWHRSWHGSIHLHGHTHSALKGNNQRLDVGVDCWNYQPINFEEIKDLLKDSPKREVNI